MPRKRVTKEQIAFALRQAENGATVDDICQKMDLSEPTFHRWKKRFVGTGKGWMDQCRSGIDEARRSDQPVSSRQGHSSAAKITDALSCRLVSVCFEEQR